ncbi:hypothetical protein [Rhizobium lentis]|uniref:Uncharacterized protein n=1 Tax=Rhizobium lentis TaxID=1138194 RepID=A0A9Q3R0K9_9HYPH|nr:hypothetical protein [Rhizobium lentis]MBX4958673.1 hypothetical protein [Rhizobium lentis]MBX4976947.1 hypothetical protein [Rhizobium lentis]MBX4988773.1 hypothetical protein [Rhizobium lentis]MBX5000756.1 hypothetical protein [Rhizobium lentis]MBX5007222.1 hypothetical protein [Rhizobium lentis]
MAGHDDRYVEITTRLRSVRSFCDFLSQGGAVRIASSDGGPWKDVTAALLERNRREAEALARTRRHLYPEFADEDVAPPLYSRH